MKKTTKLAPVHPGEILKDEFEAIGKSANAVALALRIPASRLTEILNGKRGISADTALRLARFFGTSAQFWINLQMNNELQIAEDAHAGQIADDVQPLPRAS